MRTYKEIVINETYDQKQIRQSTERRLVSVTCDLCGCEATGVSGNEPYWEPGYRISSVTVERVEGECIPDCDPERRTKRVDICPKCFEQKLVPWLEKSQGAKMQLDGEGEWDDE